jgi:hypothetical protein
MDIWNNPHAVVASERHVEGTLPPHGRARLTNPQLLAEAQVQATLALALEQRTANLIAALRLGAAGLDDEDLSRHKGPATVARAERRNLMRAEIRAALGIEGVAK